MVAPEEETELQPGEIINVNGQSNAPLITIALDDLDIRK